MDISSDQEVKAVVSNEIKVIRFDIEPKAILRILATAAILILIGRLFSFLMVFLLGLMLAVTFEPLVEKMGKLKIKRSVAIALLAFAIIGVFALFCSIILPSIYEQLVELFNRFPEIKSDFLARIPEDSAFKKFATEGLNHPKAPELTSVVSTAVPYLNVGLEAMAQTALIFIFSIYLLIDGKRTFKWFSDFFSASVRLKLRRTAYETAPIVHHYILGQLITSAASAAYTFTALSLLKVPAALTLAFLAGILDILPVLGFVIAVVPAILLALTVSPLTALIVLAAYILYHTIEAYLLTPLVYGNRLKVSSLVVLASLIIAGSIGGILFAITILPLVASYPIIEKIWLIKYLGREVIHKHESETVETPLPEQVLLWERHSAVHRRHAGALNGPDFRRALKRKIMLVEDDSDIRAVLKDILEVEGYIVVAASNGREGLELLSINADAGLIILDVSMPVMTGSEFLKQLRVNEQFSNVPVVYMTGEPDFKTSDTVSAILTKPSEIDTVLDMVEKFYRQA